MNYVIEERTKLSKTDISREKNTYPPHISILLVDFSLHQRSAECVLLSVAVGSHLTSLRLTTLLTNEVVLLWVRKDL